MYDLEMADKIFLEMSMEDPDFAKKLVKKWRDTMPLQYCKEMQMAKWGSHIISKNFYDTGLQFIKDNNGKPIEPWTVEDILKVAKNYINIDDEPYYELDLAMQTNILKGDVFPIVKEPEKVVLIAIEFLSDEDYPFSDASERAYKWVECHLDKQQKELEKEFN